MKGRWKFAVVCFGMLLSFTFIRSAAAQVGVYGGFSAANTSVPNSKWIYGTTFGGYYNVYHVPFVAVGLDARVSLLDGNNVVNGLIGPRAEFHAPFIKPYIEGLVGASKLSGGEGVAAFNESAFSYGFSAGVDVTVFPRLDWRVVDYNFTRSPNVLGGVNQDALTTGLVLRLPVPHL